MNGFGDYATPIHRMKASIKRYTTRWQDNVLSLSRLACRTVTGQNVLYFIPFLNMPYPNVPHHFLAHVTPNINNVS
jgi:hypothetical protein